MKSDFRETKRQRRLRLRLEKLLLDPSFMHRIEKLRLLRKKEDRIMGYRTSDKEIFILSQEYNFPYTFNGPITQLIDKKKVTDFADFDACRFEFMYPDYADIELDRIMSGDNAEQNIYARAFNEAYPIRIEIAADATLNEIKDCLSAHLQLLEAWQNFMHAKHDIITRNTRWNRAIHKYVLELDAQHPEWDDDAIKNAVNQKFPNAIYYENNISKIRNRLKKSNKPRRKLPDIT